MAHLLYYARERASLEANFPDLCQPGWEFDDSVTLIERLAEEHGVRIDSIERGHGSNWSKSTHTIRLAKWAGLRTALHEFGHAMDRKLHPGRRKAHTTALLDLVLDLASTVHARGWHLSIPAERLAREETEAKRHADRAAMRAVRDAIERNPVNVRTKKIERRRSQIARLERKIKGLTTRLAKARRSLAAIERAASKGETVDG